VASTLRTRLIRGVGATAFGQVVSAVIQLVSVPVFLAVWQTDRYGEWLVLSSLAAFLSMSDIGFATAAANEMTMRVGRREKEEALVVYQSLIALLFGLAIVVLATVLALVWGTPVVEWIPLHATSRQEAASVLSVFTVYILVGLQLGAVDAGFRCDGNFALGSLLNTGMRFADFLAQVIAVTLTGSMLMVATAGLAIRCIALVLFTAILSRKSPWLRHGFNCMRLATIRRLWIPAVSFLGMPLGHALGNQGTVQVVAAVLGPAAVVVFTTHRTVCNVAMQLVNMIAIAVWPEFSTSFGASDRSLPRQLHRTACRWCIWLSLAGCAALAVLGPLLIPFWTHGRIYCHFGLFAMLLSDVVLRTIWWTSSVVPMSTNSHPRLAAVYLASTTASLAGAIILTPFLGLPGAAASLLITDSLMIWYVLPSSLSAVDDNLRSFLAAMRTPPVKLQAYP
jgi:O-antigen/teichoic acid export membrane protein